MMDLSPQDLRESLRHLADTLSPEDVQRVLEFALFIKTKAGGESLYLQHYLKNLGAETESLETEPAANLTGSVIRYDDPFTPVAESEWESLQ